MKVILLSLAILLFKQSFGQNPGFKVFLIGDTGEDITLESTMKNFLDTISRYPNSATVFLGDNCYKGFRKGFDSSEVTIKRLGAQLIGLNASTYQGSVYFVPGNHDWWNVTNMKKGKRHLKMEQAFIETHLNKNQFIRNKENSFLPKDGNPVADVDLNDGELKIIFIDTHWLIIQKNDDAKAKAYSLLDSILNVAISHQQKILIAAHHPVFTIGKHSKKRSWQFPKALKDQDIYHPLYRDMRTRMEKILSQKRYPITYTSGHDHVLGYFYKDSVQYLVSGAGSKSSRYNDRKNQDFNPTPGEDIPGSQFAKVSEGYFEIDFTASDVRIKAVYYEENKAHSAFIR